MNMRINFQIEKWLIKYYVWLWKKKKKSSHRLYERAEEKREVIILNRLNENVTSLIAKFYSSEI